MCVKKEYQQNGWFIFVGDGVRDYRLIYDHAVVKKEELVAGGACDVEIKRAFAKVDE